MPPILPQMQRNGICAGLLGLYRGLNRVRVTRPARLAECRHVVNIDTEQYRL
jgi:hypothetical protein